MTNSFFFRSVSALLHISLWTSISFAQFTDNFTDNDFTANPAWSGDNTKWLVLDSLAINNKLLRSNSTILDDTFYLSTTSTTAINAQWEFWVNLNFSTSGSNYADVFLVSSSQDLKGNTNGYFVRIGNTSDDISLYKKSGATSSILIDGLNGSVSKSSNNKVKIKVTRDAANLWALLRDTLGTGSVYFTEGTVSDATYTTSNFFGVLVKQSSATFFNKHFFDDFYAGPIIGDTVAPTVSTLTVLSSTQLDVKFSEFVSKATVENVSNYSVNNGIGTPSSALRDATDSALVHLTFTTSFPNGVTDSITIGGVKDLTGNTMLTTIKTFLYFVPATATYRDVVINEVLPDPDPAVALPAAEFIEVYNRSSKVFELNGWKFSDGTSIGILTSYVLFPGAFLILCPSANVSLYSPFGPTMGLASWPSLNNTGDNLSLKDNNNVLIDAVNYSDTWYNDLVKKDGGWTLEQINSNTPCSGQSNWTASNDSSGGTPGKVNSVLNNTADTVAPTLVSASIISGNQILLTFSEAMDTMSLLNGAYGINGGLTVTTKQLDSFNYATVLLTLNPSIDTGTVYTITVTNVRDCPGNLIGTNNTAQFVISQPEAYRDVIIVEIFPDPDPPVGLPNAEFIEIYNRSAKTLNLNGWKFSDGTSTGVLGSYTMTPGGYLILCPAANIAQFTPFGPVIGLSSWTSLNNTGDNLTLKSSSGLLVDTLSYFDTWYNNSIKKDGGWTLELKNPNHPCSGVSNWTASNDSAGGTPGKKNSVFDTLPDTQPPTLLSATVISSSQVELLFSETMDTTSLVSGAYSVNNGLAVTGKQLGTTGAASVILSLNPAIDTGVFYTVTVSNIADCFGNLLPPGSTATFVLGYIPGPKDIVINEIMADPTPQVGIIDAEYVELYNTTGKWMDLSNCTFSGNAFSVGSIIAPYSFLLLSYSGNATALSFYGKTIAMSGWSSSYLTNSGKELLLIAPNGAQIDRVNYSLSWYADNNKDDGGWSLELINPKHPCSGQNNWKASTHELGGSPSRKNSVYDSLPDKTAPIAIGVTIINTTQINISFNEGMNNISLDTAAYTVNNGKNTIDVQPIAPDFTSVQLTLNSAIDSTTAYTVTFSGVLDCSGNTMATTTLLFGIGIAPVKFDVVINEIFADPDKTKSQLPEVEFLEFYNRTGKVISLANCKLSDATSSVTIMDAVIFPNSFLILCPLSNVNDFTPYGRVTGISGFPSLNNTGEPLTLRSPTDALIHTVTYSDDWYADTSKNSGGWTLEMMDPNNYCGEAYNWRASNDPRGGTPGNINSVFGSNPDIAAPTLVNAVATDNKHVTLYFSETTDSISATLASYSVNNEIFLDSVLVAGLKTVTLVLKNNLVPSVIYTVSVNGTQDCAGNTSINANVKFALAEPAAAGDIIINEVLYNPRGSGSDFVELYNNSSKIIDLQGWQLANIEGDTVSDKRPIGASQVLIFSHQYKVLLKDTANIKKEYPLGKLETYIGLSSLPSYNDDKGTVVLLTPAGTQADRFDYTKEMQFPLLSVLDGVSLERLDFNRPANDPSNWHSAAESVGFATPGYRNSQYKPTDISGDNIIITPEVFSPDNDGVDDVVNITYKFDQPGFVATVTLFDSRGRIVRSLIKKQLLGIEGTFTWDGVNDDYEKVHVGIYVIFVELFNVKGDVVTFKKTCVVAHKL